jgi:4-amino-4-deoxy-L-arabinose transferase-like glycosyltransferase
VTTSWIRRQPFVAAALITLLLALAAVGLRLATTTPSADADRYRTMAVSLYETGAFREDMVERRFPQPGEVENGHTHYFSPLWPAFQVPFYAALGPAGFEVAVLSACALALAIGWWATRDLWGDAAAFALVACLGVCLWQVTDQRGTEPLALAFFLLMLYGILRSIRPGQAPWILLAGLSAGLAYLTRSSVGWLFLVGGGAGFLWRLRFHRRKALNRHYLGAIALFGLAWALWAARNVSLFWDGTLAGLPHALAADAVFEHKFSRALEEPFLLVGLIPIKAAWGLALLSPFIFLRRRYLARQLRRLHDEEQSGLALAWIVPLVMGSCVAAVFTLADTSPPAPVLNLDNMRYFVFMVPGLLWGAWPAAPQAAATPLPQPVVTTHAAPAMRPNPDASAQSGDPNG